MSLTFQENNSLTRPSSTSRSRRKSRITRTACSRRWTAWQPSFPLPWSTPGASSPSPCGAPTTTWACRGTLRSRRLSARPWMPTALAPAAPATFRATRCSTRTWKRPWPLCTRRRQLCCSLRATWPMTRPCSRWLSPYLAATYFQMQVIIWWLLFLGL